MDNWHRYELLESDIDKVSHKFVYQDGDQKDTMRFADVRGGWAWPTDTSPFYCIILGQQFFDEEPYDDKSPVFEVIFEATDTGLDLDRRFNQLADISALYKCDFYADCSESHEPEVDSYSDHAYRMRFGDLQEAPWSDNFRLGVESCKSLVRTNKLTIPKDTEVFAQLQRITQNDLADKDIKRRYYCIEALRHVVCGFKRDPVTVTNIGINFRPLPVVGGGLDWMA
jgi:hypothetical protein